jgi:hypothetical protein
VESFKYLWNYGSYLFLLDERDGTKESHGIRIEDEFWELECYNLYQKMEKRSSSEL